jgi:tetratricopeptide (TPR) repeat protein
MRINRGIRQQLLAAGLGVSLLQPIALGAVGLFLFGAAAGEVRGQQTLNTEAIGRIAQAITVRIEGATQGSGVLVKRDGNRYTVLTAWHVVSGQRAGEELAIYTPDGRSHALEAGSIMRVGQVDLAVLTFTSEITYQLARIGDVKSVSSGSSVFVGGFPMATSSVPSRVFRFRDGRLEANARVFIPNGHQMLYTNQTLPGMSGGAVLNQEGKLVGIHASAERADKISESSGKAVATGTNQGIPISYYTVIDAGISALGQTGNMADIYLEQAKALRWRKGSEKEGIRLASNSIELGQRSEAYFIRSHFKMMLGDREGGSADYRLGLKSDPESAYVYYESGLISRIVERDDAKALASFDRAIAIDPTMVEAYVQRALIKNAADEKERAILDLNKAISLNPNYYKAWEARALVRTELGDHRGACEDKHQSALLKSSAEEPVNLQRC